MSKCQDLEPLLALYVDGDAPPGERETVEAHLNRCPPCRERVAGQRAVREVIVARHVVLRGCASQHLRARCAAHAAPARSLARAARRWLPLSLAATLVLAVAGAFMLGLNNQVEALAAQLTLDHLMCFQFAPERAMHADSADAGRAWAASQGWPLQIPASSADAQLELLGVRRCFMSGKHVAHVLYKWRGQPLSVFVVPQRLRRSQANEIVEKFGHEAVVWSAGDRTYVVLARGRPSELEPVVGYVRANAR
jgi:anti-sigma factor RsiW